MVSGISNNIVQSASPLQSYQPQYTSSTQGDTLEPLTSFDDEDTAIISSQAKMLNELDKFNSGAGNDVELVMSEVMAKTTVGAEVDVINTKKDMIDNLLKLGE